MLLVFTWPPHVLPSPQPTLQPPGTSLRAPRFLLPPWVSSFFLLPPTSTQAMPPLTLPSFSRAFSPSIHPLPQNRPSSPSRIIPGRCLSCLCKRKRRSGPGLLTDISCPQCGGFGGLRRAAPPPSTRIASAGRPPSCTEGLQLSISPCSPHCKLNRPERSPQLRAADSWGQRGTCGW